MKNKRHKSLKRQLSEEHIQAARARIDPAPPNPNRFRRGGEFSTDPNDVNWRDPSDFYRTRLHKAAEASDLLNVKRLLAERACPFIRDADGKTAVGAALNRGHIAIAKLICAEMSKQHSEWHAYRMRHDRRYRYKQRQHPTHSLKDTS